MISKNIHHQRPSIFLMLLISVYLIHSTNGKSVVVMVKEPRTLTHVVFSESRLSKDDATATKEFVEKLIQLDIVIDMVFTSNKDEGTKISDFIRRERNQTPQFGVKRTDLLKIPTRSETPETFENRITNFWTTNVKPLIEQGKNILIVAPIVFLDNLVVFLRRFFDGQITEYVIQTLQPFFYEFDESMKILVNKTDL